MNLDKLLALVAEYAAFSVTTANVDGNSLIDFVGWLKKNKKI